jgi:two-component system OmpR family sensor kinase
MRSFRSIRWRLQIWHGLMLAIVLLGFALTAWRLELAGRFQRVDQELERRVAAVDDLIRRGGDSPGPPPRNGPPDGPPPPDGPRPPRPPDERPRDRGPAGFDGESDGYYYVAWRSDGREISRSTAAPPNVPFPGQTDGPRAARTREAFREYIHTAPPEGDRILVGREIRDELAGMRRFAWLLGGAGSTVFVLGLAGGWWISRRELRPIADISATAVKIAKGDLAQRIPIDDVGELSDLAGVLNDTFAQLHESLVRQARFTADASHELRTPVSVLLTQTQSTLARERSVAEYQESLEACQNAAQRMRRLIDGLLTLARLDAGEARAPRTACDLDRIAGDAVELLNPLTRERGLTMITDLKTAPCHGDPGQLGQVTANLIGNAIHYNRPGGTVIVKTAVEPGTAVVSVADTGPGIASEDLPHIFERFYRADKARSNDSGRTGLGLAIARAIVEAHGGTIDVASNPGEGSTFTVRIPQTPETPEVSSPR